MHKENDGIVGNHEVIYDSYGFWRNLIARQATVALTKLSEKLYYYQCKVMYSYAWIQKANHNRRIFEI